MRKIIGMRIPEDTYKSFLHYSPVPTVDVLFFDTDMGKTLLFKRNNEPLQGKYFSMGGRIAKNESLLDAAVRKTKEETGMTINKRKLFFGGAQGEIYTKSIFPTINLHCIDIYFGYILNGNEKITLDTQHCVAKWFSVSDMKLHSYLKSKIKNLKITYAETH